MLKKTSSRPSSFVIIFKHEFIELLNNETGSICYWLNVKFSILNELFEVLFSILGLYKKLVVLIKNSSRTSNFFIIFEDEFIELLNTETDHICRGLNVKFSTLKELFEVLFLILGL